MIPREGSYVSEQLDILASEQCTSGVRCVSVRRFLHLWSGAGVRGPLTLDTHAGLQLFSQGA